MLLVALGPDEVTKRCSAENVSVSVIEPLQSGGVRLVCNSSYGAAQMARKFKPHLIDGAVMRERHRPAKPLW